MGTSPMCEVECRRLLNQEGRIRCIRWKFVFMAEKFKKEIKKKYLLFVFDACVYDMNLFGFCLSLLALALTLSYSCFDCDLVIFYIPVHLHRHRRLDSSSVLFINSIVVTNSTFLKRK